jgi:hypothetical protein
MEIPEKLFTLDEVNALIPQLESLLVQIQLRYVKVQNILGKVEEGVPPQDMERQLREHPELRTFLDEIQRYVAAIQEMGGQFKGVELGLVDFPFLHENKIALLCWQFGEKEIRWWHGTDTGFSGRRPLPGTIDKTRLN